MNSELAFLECLLFVKHTQVVFHLTFPGFTAHPSFMVDIFMPGLQSKKARFKDGEESGQGHTADKSEARLPDFGLLTANPFSNTHLLISISKHP